MNKKNLTFLSVLFVMVLVVTSCSSAKTPTSNQSQTAADPIKEQTLIVWDQYQRDVESKVMDTLNAEFEKAHPGVKIERVVKTLDDLKVTEKLALSKADGPDVAQVNQGRSDMGALVQAKMIMPLNDYAMKFGWDKIFTSSLSGRNTMTPDGKTIGQGDIYGVSATAEIVGVFYNKTLFEKKGWKVPTSFEEFETLLKTIKADNETPIAFGSLDGWPAIHLYSAIQHLFVTPEYINSLTYGVNEVSFDTPENQKAAQILMDWTNAGYFTDGYAGIGYDDNTKTFKAGQGAMTITGSWLAPELETGTDQKFGFFQLPAPEGKPALAIGAPGIPFAIRQGTEKADLAAEYLNWMVSPRASELWTGISALTAMPLAEGTQLDETTLFADMVKAWDSVNKASLVGQYIDWATPTFYDTLVAELQKLLGGITTPTEFTSAVEQDYSNFLKGN